jgi:hypothetical protein
MNRFLALLAVVPLLTTALLADDSSSTNSTDKSQYNLFNPTPHDLLRPMNSDQYDNVLDAHTLDAGHFQVEGSLVNYYKYSKSFYYPGLNYRYAEDEYSWTPRFRVGLLNNLELEVNPTFSERSENVAGGFAPPSSGYPASFNATVHHGGFGDIGVGPKINLWGNDGGMTSLAIHPYFSVPVDGGDLQGGVDVPFGLKLPYGFYLKLNTEFYATEIAALGVVEIDTLQTLTKRIYIHYVGFDNSISLHKSLSVKTAVYWYLDSNVTSDSGQPWYGYTGFGMTYSLTSDFEVYAGMGFGLVQAAYDYNPRFGIVFRF